MNLPNTAPAKWFRLRRLVALVNQNPCLSSNYKTEGEYIIIEGWQVQFLPPGDALGEEALAQAIAADVGGLRTWVMTAEYLVALALQLGRPKDFARILQFIDAGVLDAKRLDQILTRYDLLAKWEQFGDKFIRNK